jgi:hypothetical protein
MPLQILTAILAKLENASDVASGSSVCKRLHCLSKEAPLCFRVHLDQFMRDTEEGVERVQQHNMRSYLFGLSLAFPGAARLLFCAGSSLEVCCYELLFWSEHCSMNHCFDASLQALRS